MSSALKRIWQSLFRGDVSRVFVILILLFSTVITLLLTGLQLWRDYRYELNVLDQRLEQVRISNLESISQSVWTYNLSSLEIQLQGLVRQQDISFISVENGDGEVLLSVGEDVNEDALQQSYALTYIHRDSPRLLGQLHVKASLQGIYGRLLDTFLVILITQAVKTFLVSMFIIYLFDRMLMRHLRRLVDQLGRHYSRAQPFSIERSVTEFNKGDELNTLVGALNRLQNTVESEHRKLEQLASFDSLTGLPNRMQLKETLDTRIQAGQPFWLGILDVNDFKNINDTLGHQSGDQVLYEIGLRLKCLQSPHCFFARLGGDEFACVFDSEAPARTIADTILQKFEAPFLLHAVQIQLSVSIGLVSFPDQAADAQQLMKFADIAMYHCKKSRSEFARFDPQLDEHSLNNLTLMTDARQALESKQFCLHYQTQVDSDTGEVSGLEALIRWHHPTQGFISPDDFIPSLELSGDINALSCWVLEQALTDYEQLKPHLSKPLALSINISALNLLEERFLTSVEAIMQRFPVRPTLVMEITENALMSDPEYAGVMMQALVKQGVEFSIDDYGTGYSSLSYLSRLPVSELKIDRSFIFDMETDLRHFTIVQSTVNLAKSLALRTVAEGCETEISSSILKDLNCDKLQGYFFSRPVSIEELISEFQCVASSNGNSQSVRLISEE